MKFVTFSRRDREAEPGVIRKNRIFGIRDLGFSSLVELASSGQGIFPELQDWLANQPADGGIDLKSVHLMSPIQKPSKIICVGLNYRDHAVEAKMPIPSVPTIFSKFTTSIIGPGEAIILPRNSIQPDYEAELAFVIGTGGRHIPIESWRDHLFGYTIMNDVSARDYQFSTSQWQMGKSFDTFAPIGPWIVSSDAIPDPHELDIKLRINQEILQDSNTRELIFNIPELIAYLSSVFTLEPGDIVSTGTPSGVGIARVPPRFLRCGDEVTISIEGIGELRNHVVAETDKCLS